MPMSLSSSDILKQTETKTPNLKEKQNKTKQNTLNFVQDLSHGWIDEQP